MSEQANFRLNINLAAGKWSRQIVTEFQSQKWPHMSPNEKKAFDRKLDILIAALILGFQFVEKDADSELLYQVAHNWVYIEKDLRKRYVTELDR